MHMKDVVPTQIALRFSISGIFMFKIYNYEGNLFYSNCIPILYFGYFFAYKTHNPVAFFTGRKPLLRKLHSNSPLWVFLGTKRTIRLYFIYKRNPSHVDCTPILRFGRKTHNLTVFYI